MNYIVSYQKYTTTDRTVEIRLPMADSQFVGTELATLADTTYVSIPEGAMLPGDQPAEISASIVNPAVLTDSLKNEIRAASPHCKLISQRMIDMIRSSYTIDDEMYFARIGVGAAAGLYVPTESEMSEMTVFGEFVESVREWGRLQRAGFGL